ncbi:MAG: tripartite tricarboxylate transporter TctB family protein [Gammaproteobacteria bacterium]
MQTLLARRDLLAGALLLIFGIGYGLLTLALPNRSLPNTPGPALFPTIISAGLISLSIALIVRSVRKGESGATAAAVFERSQTLALAGFLAFIVVLPYAGFVAASIPFFAGMTWLYGERRVVVVAVSALLIPLLLYYVFRFGFQVLLPVGIW